MYLTTTKMPFISLSLLELNPCHVCLRNISVSLITVKLKTINKMSNFDEFCLFHPRAEVEVDCCSYLFLAWCVVL